MSVFYHSHSLHVERQEEWKPQDFPSESGPVWGLSQAVSTLYPQWQFRNILCRYYNCLDFVILSERLKVEALDPNIEILISYESLSSIPLPREHGA